MNTSVAERNSSDTHTVSLSLMLMPGGNCDAHHGSGIRYLGGVAVKFAGIRAVHFAYTQ